MCCLRQDNILEHHYFIVDKRDRLTLLPIIVQEIELETTIYSDECRAHVLLKIMVFFTKQLITANTL